MTLFVEKWTVTKLTKHSQRSCIKALIHVENIICLLFHRGISFRFPVNRQERKLLTPGRSLFLSKCCKFQESTNSNLRKILSFQSDQFMLIHGCRLTIVGSYMIPKQTIARSFSIICIISIEEAIHGH